MRSAFAPRAVTPRAMPRRPQIQQQQSLRARPLNVRPTYTNIARNILRTIGLENVSQHVPSNNTVKARINNRGGGGGGNGGNNGGNSGNNQNGNKNKSVWWNILLDMLVTMSLAEACTTKWEEDVAKKIFADALIAISTSRNRIKPIQAAMILLKNLSNEFKELQQSYGILFRPEKLPLHLYSIVGKPEFKEIISSCGHTQP